MTLTFNSRRKHACLNMFGERSLDNKYLKGSNICLGVVFSANFLCILLDRLLLFFFLNDLNVQYMPSPTRHKTDEHAMPSTYMI